MIVGYKSVNDTQPFYLILALIKLVLGKSNVQNGLQIILKYFQDPLLNKQVSYCISHKYLFEFLFFCFLVILYDSR